MDGSKTKSGTFLTKSCAPTHLWFEPPKTTTIFLTSPLSGTATKGLCVCVCLCVCEATQTSKNTQTEKHRIKKAQ